MLAERGVNVDHSTIYRWVQRYAPEMEKRLRWYWRNPSDLCPWHMDETPRRSAYCWAYSEPGCRQPGAALSIFISPPVVTAKLHTGFWVKSSTTKKCIPRFINTDKAPAYGRALALLKREGRCLSDVEHRQIK